MVKITKDKGINKDGFPTGGVDIGDSRGEVITDPRSEILTNQAKVHNEINACLLYTSPSPRDLSTSRMPSSA